MSHIFSQKLINEIHMHHVYNFTKLKYNFTKLK